MKRRWLRWLLIALIALLLPPTVLVRYVAAQEQGKVYSEIAALPAAPVALVLGAGLNRDGTPGEMLTDRVNAAVGLYRAGKVQSLLMSGANGEPAAMQRYAVGQGVPASSITQDDAGTNTSASCRNAALHLASVIVVTQAYHLPRSLYLCNSLGLAAVGYVAGRDWYPDQLGCNGREFLSTVLAWFEVQGR